MIANRQCDVIIVGAGLAGLACAQAIAGPHMPYPLDVVVIDGGPPLADRNPYKDTRGSAITAGSKMMLEGIGIWPLLSEHAQSFEKIIVTNEGDDTKERPAFLSFIAELKDDQPTAWMLENAVIVQNLIQQVTTNPAITVVTGDQVENVEFGSAHNKLTLSSGESIEAPLVIGADGRSSFMRKQAGIGTTGWQYDQSGITATVAHEHPHEGCAQEHFRPQGPLAILPLSGNRSTIVWTEKTDEADRIAALPKRAFEDELSQVFDPKLGKIEVVGDYSAWPLSLQIAEKFTTYRLALIGDAAHVIHPIAGLGLNLGLRDIAAITECIADSIRLGLDFGAAASLDRYESWRRPDTLMTAAVCDGLNRLFSNEISGVSQLRKAGLQLVDKVPPVKDFFMDRAAGVIGEQPKLMRGEPF